VHVEVVFVDARIASKVTNRQGVEHIGTADSIAPPHTVRCSTVISVAEQHSQSARQYLVLWCALDATFENAPYVGRRFAAFHAEVAP